MINIFLNPPFSKNKGVPGAFLSLIVPARYIVTSVRVIDSNNNTSALYAEGM